MPPLKPNPSSSTCDRDLALARREAAANPQPSLQAVSRDPIRASAASAPTSLATGEAGAQRCVQFFPVKNTRREAGLAQDGEPPASMEFAHATPMLHLAVEGHFSLPVGVAALERDDAEKSRPAQAGGKLPPAFRQAAASVASKTIIRFRLIDRWWCRGERFDVLCFAIIFHEFRFRGLGDCDQTMRETGRADDLR